MKCYIATYYQYDNYGTRLQNYALVKTLENKEIETNTICLVNKKTKIKNIIKTIFSYFPFSLKCKNWKNDYKKKKCFKKFNTNLNLIECTKKDLYSKNYENSFAIAGSDQIWSPNHLKNNPQDIDLFFLRFISKDKRFSYAPSFGVSDIELSSSIDFYNNLKEFNKLTIREETGKKIIKKIINEESLVMPDPVFLLNKSEWTKEIGNRVNDKNNYVALYFLSEQNQSIIKDIEKFAKENECSIKIIMGNTYDRNLLLPNPIEFIEIIKNAEYIFTDSFHASVFSIIFNKKFTVFPRSDVKQISRIENLLNKFECNNFLYNGYIQDIKNREYLQNINELLNKEKQKGISYIDSIIEEVKKNGEV